MIRPVLDLDLSADDFLDYYWLKAELVAFCRESALPVSGAKTELVERIAAFLRDGTVLRPSPARRVHAEPMPDTLSLDTVIGRGWTCGQRLRAFFVSEVGSSFRFNQALIHFIREGEGRTLEEAVDAWRASKAAGPRKIPRQLEYNRHTRAYMEAHPEATPSEVREAWWEKRRRRRSEWGDESGSR
ncbi:MAG: DUF6434 domain-containing protein [Rubricoccaceae bacterium]